jgi:hypothetical protein
MSKRARIVAAVLGVSLLALVFVFRSQLLFVLVDHYILPLEIGQSGGSFRMGDLFVIEQFGFSEDGDRLRFMVIRQ